MRCKCRNLKPIGGLTVIVVTLFSLTPLIEAGTWRDDFENEDFDGWMLRNSHSVWFVFDDALWARVQAPGLPVIADFLEFTAFPGPYDQFTVTLTNPSFILNIGLGKMFSETGSPDIFFYRFFSTYISADQIPPSGGGPVGGFRGWLPRNPGTLWPAKPVNKLTVHFDTGRFQYVADGQLRADFEDPHFDQIEFITVMIVGVDGAQGQVDAFEISGPGIGGLAVQPKGKLATTWGRIKR